MWVQIPAWPVAALVSLSKTLNHNCFVLRMGRKAVGPVCCVMHVKEPRTLIVKERGLAPVFLDSRLEHPAGWICARYKSSVITVILHEPVFTSAADNTVTILTSNLSYFKSVFQWMIIFTLENFRETFIFLTIRVYSKICCDVLK